MLSAEQQVTWMYSDDLDTHAGFYRDRLGLPQVLDQGACRVFQVSPSGFLGVCNTAGRPRGTDGVIFTFLVADVEATHADLTARGVVFDGPPSMQGGDRVYSAFFKDPVGYRLEIQEFFDPRWPYPAGRGPRA